MLVSSTFHLKPPSSTVYLDNEDQFISEVQYEITHANAPTAQISLLDCTVCEVLVYVVDTFDNDATLSIGTDADSNSLLSASDNDCQTVAQYCNDSLLFKVTEPLKVNLSGSPTTGRAIIQLKYYRK